MSRGLNQCQLLGFLGKDPEVMQTSGGTIIATLSLATSDRRKVNGDWVDATEWHTLKLFNRTAEVARDYCRKGSQVFVDGKIQTRSWEDSNSGEKKYRTEVLVNNLILLSPNSNSNHERQQDETRPPVAPDSTEITDDDIPF